MDDSCYNKDKTDYDATTPICGDDGACSKCKKKDGTTEGDGTTQGTCPGKQTFW